MVKKYYSNYFMVAVLGLLITLSACKKESQNNNNGGSNLSGNTTTSGALNLGLWESDSSIYKLLYIEIPKVGTQTVNQFLVFDTGSGGMVIDGHDDPHQPEACGAGGSRDDADYRRNGYARAAERSAEERVRIRVSPPRRRQDRDRALDA